MVSCFDQWQCGQLVISGCGQWSVGIGMWTMEGPVGVVTGGGQGCVVSGCGQWVKSVDVVSWGTSNWVVSHFALLSVQ